MIIATAPAVVNPAPAEVFPLAFRDEFQALESDARDLADEPTDAEWDVMADEAACRDMYESGLGTW